MSGTLDFTQLVDDHYAALYRFAFSLTGNEHDASDLTQQTFLIWAAKGSSLREPAKAKSWLFTTLHREFLQRQRRQARFHHHELEEVKPELPEVPFDVGNLLDGEALLSSLAQVDETFQAPIALFYLQDFSYPEIAEILQIPIGTVKSRISRGIAQLQRNFLRDHLEQAGKSKSRE